MRNVRYHRTAPLLNFRDALEVAFDHVRDSLQRTAARRKRLYDMVAVNRKFPVGSWVLRYYPPAAQHKLGSSWTPPSRSTGQRDPEKPIVFVHVDDLKLCPGPQDISWVPSIPTATSLCASTVAFRPGSHVSDITPDPSVDVSAWGDENGLPNSSTVLKNLDQPIDLMGHVLSPFYHSNIMYQDGKFHSIAHLMCYRYAIANGLKTFATKDTQVVSTFE